MTANQVGAFEVTEAELRKLGSGELVELLGRLLHAEGWVHRIPQRSAQGTFEINRPDGGEDYRIHWEGGPDQTDFIPRRFTVFQSKAEKLNLTKVRSVPISGKGKLGELNLAVQEVVENNGAYILFSNKTNVTTPSKPIKGSRSVNSTNPRKTQQSALVEKLRDVIREKTGSTQVVVDFYGTPRIRDWVNGYPAVALWVKKRQGTVAANFAFLPAEDWASYPDVDTTNYVSHPTALAHIDIIRNTMTEPRKVIRLIGHSGIGKSRLAFESLQNGAGKDLSALVVYARKYESSIINQVRNLVGTQCRGIVVIDECPPDAHRTLSDEVRRLDSQLSLLTLDHSFAGPAPEDQLITLDHAPTEVIKAIIGEFAIGDPSTVDAATEFCAGYPQIAVLVGKAMSEGTEYFANFKDNEAVVKKLVWGYEPVNDERWRVLRTAAIFSAIGIREPKHGQLEWVATRLLGITADEFLLRLEYFEERRVVQRQGYSLNVVPRPIAARLAAEFWVKLTEGQRQAINFPDMPDELKQALCERLADLNYLPNAREVAAQMCGPNGPFGTAEALNTETGAHCLRELAVVAPAEVLETLERCLGGWTTEGLREQFGPGRRWTVWALEALAWDVGTFENAIRLLFRLAVSENETWANNATNEFAGRFSWQMGGTEASLSTRAGVLEGLVNDSTPSDLDALLRALKILLESRGGTRVLGSENQGTRKPYVDYHPETWGEIFDYANRGLGMLRSLAEQHPDRLDDIRLTLAESVSGLVVMPLTIREFEETTQVLNANRGVWSELLASLSRTLRYELADAEPKVSRPVRTLFDKFLPTTLRERIEFFVKKVDWGYEDPDGEEDKDFEAPTRRAEALGKECALDHQTFLDVLPDLSSGESKHSFAFGRSLLDASDRESDLINAAVACLRDVNNPNPSLLAGFVASVAARDTHRARGLIGRIIETEGLVEFGPYFASIALSPDLLDLLTRLVQNGQLAPKDLSVLALGRVLEPLPPASVRLLLDALRQRGVEGAFVALDLVSMYVHGDRDRTNEMLEIASQVLRTPGLLRAENITTMSEHHLESVAMTVLNSPRLGAELAEHLTRELLVVNDNRTYRTNRVKAKLARHLLDLFPVQFMARLAEEIEQGPPSISWQLEHLLSSRTGGRGKEKIPFVELDQEFLAGLCARYPKRFALYVARVAPLFIADSEPRTWTDVALMLFERLGRRNDILAEIAANLRTGFWSGPTSMHLQRFVAPLKQLFEHKELNVRRWAKREVSAIERQIDGEILDEQERKLRGG